MPVPSDFLKESGLKLEQNFLTVDNVFFELERIEHFEDLRNRVVIDWGKGTLSWHQWLSKKMEALLTTKK